MFVFSLTSLHAQLNVSIDSVDVTAYPDVRVRLSVRQGGMLLPNIDPQNITLSEDGKTIAVTSITCSDTIAPSRVSVMLLFDRSGSMLGTPLDDAKSAGSSFVLQLNASDEAAVMTFETGIQLVSGFTSDKPTLLQAIQSIRSGSKTNLWQACMQAIRETAPRTNRRAIVLLTDGFNSDEFITYTVDSVIAYAKKTSIPFYTIGLEGAVDSVSLQRLAQETGGAYYFSPTSADLASIYNEIAKLISKRGVCELVYRSGLRCLDGGTHELNLEVLANGNYGETYKSFNAPKDVRTLTQAQVLLPRDAVIDAQTKFIFPIGIESGSGSLSFSGMSFLVRFDTSELALNDVTTSLASAGFTTSIQSSAAGFRIAFMGSSNVNISGSIGSLSLTVKSNGNVSKKQKVVVDEIAFENSCSYANAEETIITINGSCERAIRPGASTSQQSSMLITNHPNPFGESTSSGAPATTISFFLARSGYTRLLLYNQLGKKIKTLLASDLREGMHDVTLDGTALLSGFYFIRLVTDDTIDTKRITLFR